MNNVFREHYKAIVVAVFVGFICIAPQLFFIFSLGDAYHGVYLMSTANETEYLSRIHEINDGHGQLGSVALFEYKDSPFVIPPNIYEFAVAGGSSLFGVSISTVVIIMKAIAPAILFLLIYWFILLLTEEGMFTKNIRIFNAIVGGLLVIFGYDLIDFRTVWKYFAGTISPAAFLLWTRPSNPILGGILLFSLFIVLWKLNREYKERTSWKTSALIFGGGFFTAAMIMSYYFSWTLAFAVGGVLGIINIFRKRWFFVRRILAVYIAGLLFALPYWTNTYRTLKNPWYHDMALRVGAFWGHVPIINKFVFATTVVFFLLTLLFRRLIRLEPSKISNKQNYEWWWFCVSALCASWIVFTQQILTGYTIWPFHYVQYTIPLGVISTIIICFYSVRNIVPRAWYVAMIFLAFASVVFGIYTQTSAYKHSYNEYLSRQRHGALFSWINKHAKPDCVILSSDDFIIRSIPAFTHCNIYYSGLSLPFLIPQTRIVQGYMLSLRLRGIKEQDIDRYVFENSYDIIGSVYAMGGLARGIDAPVFRAFLSTFPAQYQSFLNRPLRNVLQGYSLDYVLFDGDLNDKLLKDLGIVKENFVYRQDRLTLYAF